MHVFGVVAAAITVLCHDVAVICDLLLEAWLAPHSIRDGDRTNDLRL